MKKLLANTRLPYALLNAGDQLNESERAAFLTNIFTPSQEKAIAARAEKCIQHMQSHGDKTSLQSFISQFDLVSEQGVALLCLAEALLRIPDRKTRNLMIYDTFKDIPLSSTEHPLHKFASFGLKVGGWFLDKKYAAKNGLILKLLGASAEPFIEQATLFFVKKMGEHFVMSETIKDALKKAKKSHYRYSFDMLGESALTDADAKRYFESYRDAIVHIGKQVKGQSFHDRPSISVKLSALYPRYEFLKREDVLKTLFPKVLELCELSYRQGTAFTIDAEESERLALSLELVHQLNRAPSLEGWEGLGLAVQAYGTRCLDALQFLKKDAQDAGRKLCIRLVKGAYWDREIKYAQERGHERYPVYTRKNTTDAAYLKAARFMLENSDIFYAQFATHNAYSVAAIEEMAKDKQIDYEFQKLYGMGDDLYDFFLKDAQKPCRVYAPVGYYHDLLPYLVRRLLENGANTSFVHVAQSEDIKGLVQNPFKKLAKLENIPHKSIPLPQHIYQNRLNAKGFDIQNPYDLVFFEESLEKLKSHLPLNIHTLGDFSFSKDEKYIFTSPNNNNLHVSDVYNAVPHDVQKAYSAGLKGFDFWKKQPLEDRANVLNAMADKLEEKMSEFVALAMVEAGKTLEDGIGEVREAIDFLRYYALTGQKLLAPQTLQGVTGEENILHFHGRGVFVCISPWNFPLAIFLGQIAAALMAGNAVLAKPSEQTTAIAFKAVSLFYEVGLPRNVLQLIIGPGSKIGGALVSHPQCAGVAFTGSTEVAHILSKTLADKGGPIVPLIAETGGQNAMIVDSTALPEQVVQDMIISGFQSAGQRCSAMRIAFVQRDIFKTVYTMLCGAMDKLKVSDTTDFQTDIGPVIDREALKGLQDYVEELKPNAKRFYTQKVPDTGTFMAPHLFEVDFKTLPKSEVFGPVVHMVPYDDLDEVIAWVNSTGYGLTLGIQSRIKQQVQSICERVSIGNIYVNRSMIGAVVGVQPFGGEGLSGTGPKAGSPYTLLRYSAEHTRTVNTTAEGGNRALLTLPED